MVATRSRRSTSEMQHLQASNSAMPENERETQNMSQDAEQAPGSSGFEEEVGVAGEEEKVEQLTPAQLSRLRSIAERAFRTKNNEEEAGHALKIFESLCSKWHVASSVKNEIWRELETRYPELDRRRALRRMSRLLRVYVELYFPCIQGSQRPPRRKRPTRTRPTR